MKKVLVIGLSGKSLFFELPYFPRIGETITSNYFHVEYGGKGFNQALAIARMGLKCDFITKLGKDDIAEKCVKILNDYDITSHIIYSANKSSAVATILTTINGENEVILHPGASDEILFEEIIKYEEVFKNTDYVLLQQEIPLLTLEKIIDLASKYKTKIILNPAPARYKLSDLYLNKIYLLTPNENEFRDMFEIPTFIKTTQLGEYYCQKYKNSSLKIIVTLGEKGALIIENDSFYFIDAEKVVAVDSTGAGDVFNGILTAMLAKNYSLFDAVKLANKGAALSVTKKYVIDAIPTFDNLITKK